MSHSRQVSSQVARSGVRAVSIASSMRSSCRRSRVRKDRQSAGIDRAARLEHRIRAPVTGLRSAARRGTRPSSRLARRSIKPSACSLSTRRVAPAAERPTILRRWSTDLPWEGKRRGQRRRRRHPVSRGGLNIRAHGVAKSDNECAEEVVRAVIRIHGRYLLALSK